MTHRKHLARLVVLAASLAFGLGATAQVVETARATPTEVQAPTAEELDALRIALDAPVFAEREMATNALIAAGAAAVPYLEQAALGESLEAADRAVWALQQLADANDESVQLAVLEVLVAVDRFPAIAREAEMALAELNAEICRKRLRDLGAEFIAEPERDFRNGAFKTTMSIKVNTNREEWTGEATDLHLLTKLRRVGKVIVASELVDDELAAKLAGIDGLESLILIETQASNETVAKLKANHPDLQLIVHKRTKLGVRFYPGQPLNVTEVISDSPAHHAGMRAGDHVIEFAGKPVDSFHDLTALISQHSPGEAVTITVKRGAEQLTLTAKLGGTDWWEELKDN